MSGIVSPFFTFAKSGFTGNFVSGSFSPFRLREISPRMRKLCVEEIVLVKHVLLP
ncbi:hypothetical protein A2U01_0055980, partial [Trifolium medium]|nr:hypothetical protein [Trifolium medium]